MQIIYYCIETLFENITEHSYHRLICNTAIDSQMDSILPIEMTNVSFYYGEKQVLRNVSLEAEKGGKYALMVHLAVASQHCLKFFLDGFRL